LEIQDKVAGLPGEKSISKCWVRWRERFRDGDNAVLKIFSVVINLIEKWSSDRFSCSNLPDNFNTYPDIDNPVFCHIEIINKYKNLQSRPSGGKVLSPADRKSFPRSKTRAGKSYIKNPGNSLFYNRSMEYHTA